MPSMSSARPIVSIGRWATKELLNSMSRIMDAGDESDGADHVNVCADVKLTCRDGVVMWNRFARQSYVNLHTSDCQNRLPD